MKASVQATRKANFPTHGEKIPLHLYHTSCASRVGPLPSALGVPNPDIL